MAKKEKEEVKKQTPEETPQEPVEETPKEKTPEEPKQKDANPWEEKYNSEHEARLRLAAEYDKDDPLDTHGGAQQHAGQRMDGHLGAAVDGNAGGDLTAQLHHA